MALAIDRRADHRQHRAGRPAAGRPASRRRACRASTRSTRDSPWPPETGDMEQAKAADGARSPNPKTNITLLLNDSPGHREIAVAVQAHWKELGIDSHDQAAGVGAVPRVPRPAAGRRRRRLPARLDRRLRRRDQLPRALDVRLGEQLDELLQQGVRHADRGGTRTPDNDARYELYARGGGDPVRGGRRHAGHRRSTGTRTSTWRSCPSRTRST